MEVYRYTLKRNISVFSDKIRQKQDQDVDKHSKSTSKSLSAIEEFCEKFDQSVRKSYIKVCIIVKTKNSGISKYPRQFTPWYTDHRVLVFSRTDAKFCSNQNGASLHLHNSDMTETLWRGM